MYTPTSGGLYMEPDIFVYEKHLEVAKVFVYLGSKLSNDDENKQGIWVLW